MKRKEAKRRKEIKKWLKMFLLSGDKPLRMGEICDAARENRLEFSWADIAMATDNLIKENKAKSMIFAGSEEWGLEIIFSNG